MPRKKKPEFPPVVYGGACYTGEWEEGEDTPQLLIFHRNVGGVEHDAANWKCDCSPILIPADAYEDNEQAQEEASQIVATYVC